MVSPDPKPVAVALHNLFTQVSTLYEGKYNVHPYLGGPPVDLPKEFLEGDWALYYEYTGDIEPRGVWRYYKVDSAYKLKRSQDGKEWLFSFISFKALARDANTWPNTIFVLSTELYLEQTPDKL